jgi:flagellar biosynthesis/type III secretory pathway protein FliH
MNQELEHENQKLALSQIPTFGQISPKEVIVSNNLSCARQVLELAEQKAKEIIALTEVRSKQLLENAYNQGFIEGQNQATSELLSAEEIRKALIRSSKDDLLEIITEITKNVVGEITDKDIQSIRQQILKAVDQAVFSKSVQIYIHPDDLLKLNKSISSDNYNPGQPNRIKYISTEKMPQGIVKIKSDLCELNTSPTLYLDNLIYQLEKSNLLESAINNFINKACDACDIKI